MAPRQPKDPREIPDLEVAPPAARVPSQARSREQGAMGRPADAARSLELDGGDLESGSRRANRSGEAGGSDSDFDLGLSLGTSDFELQTPMTTGAGAPSTPPPGPWPHLRPVLAEHFAPTRDEIAVLVPWGEPPRWSFEAVAYAWAVFRGQRVLERQLEVETARQRHLDNARQQRAIEWFERHRLRLEQDPKYAPELRTLEGVTRELESVRQGYDAQTLTHEQLKRSADEAALGYRERIAEGRALDASLVEGRQEASLELGRARARRQRLEIELRAGHLGASDYALKAEQLDRAVAAVEERLSDLELQARQVKQRILADELSLRSHEDQLRQRTREAQGREQALELQMSASRLAANRAKLELLSRWLILRDAELFSPSVRAEWCAFENELGDSARRVACLMAARDSYDREKARQGVILVFIAIVLLLLPTLYGVCF